MSRSEGNKIITSLPDCFALYMESKKRKFKYPLLLAEFFLLRHRGGEGASMASNVGLLGAIGKRYVYYRSGYARLDRQPAGTLVNQAYPGRRGEPGTHLLLLAAYGTVTVSQLIIIIGASINGIRQ